MIFLAKIFNMKLIQLIETNRMVLVSMLGPMVTQVLRQFSLNANSRCMTRGGESDTVEFGGQNSR